MTHTKETWVTVECGSYLAIYPEAPGRHAQIARTAQHNSPTGLHEREANAARIVSCVNALAGIPDPAAFVQAARGMAEALEATTKALSYAVPVFPNVERKATAALAAFRAQMGEAP
jgi:hypothetical protein